MQSGSTPQTPDYFADLKTPEIEKMRIQLEELVSQGTLSPEEAQTVLLESSAMNGISLDPNLKKSQMDALLGLQDISDSGGMTAMDRANLNRIASEEQARTRGARDAIMQNAQARGMGGSGMELMNQLLNEQESATRGSQRDLDVAGMAQERALQALMQGGQLAGQIGAQDFGQQAQVAQANDAISRFNAQNQQNQINQNVQARNAAQAGNLAQSQRIADSNTVLRNEQQLHNKGLEQVRFDNEMKKRSGQAGIAQGNSQAAGQDSWGRAGATNQLIGGLIGGAATAISMGGGGSTPKKAKDGGLVDGEPTEHDSQHYMLQPGEMVVRKEDVPQMMKAAHTGDDGEFDVAGFLDQITGGKYQYSKGKK